MTPGRIDADVVVIGSALGGLVAAAILARRGRRVIVLEAADACGGRMGGTRTAEGYWIDFGHRDGHDVGDCQLVWRHGVEAAREAGVTLRLHRVRSPLRVHRMADGRVSDAAWDAQGFRRMAIEALDCPPEAVAAFEHALVRLASADRDEVEAAIPVRLGDWVAVNLPDPAVREAVLRMAAIFFHPEPRRASAGRLMEFLQIPKDGPFIPDDDEAGGMQGVIEPFARAVRAHGGTIALGWKPLEILTEGGAVHGAVAVDRSNLVCEARARVIVSTYPAWESVGLLAPSAVPQAFRGAAEALAAEQADVVGWQAGLRRVPRIRASGVADAHDGWNRLLGAEGSYRGGYQITSLSSRRAAPEGHHLLSLAMARFSGGRPGPPSSWNAARPLLDESIAYLRRYYADLDECVEWSAYQHVAAPQSTSWAWAPFRRHGVTVDGLSGLLLATSTVEAPAGIVDATAWAGLECARRADALLSA